MREEHDPGQPIRRLLWTTLLAVALSSSSAVAAEAQWSLRVAAAGVWPGQGELTATLPGAGPFRLTVDEGFGVGLELERRLGRRLGLEVSALAADLDARFAVDLGGLALADTESASFELWSLGVNYHLMPERATDLHLGLFAAITYLDDLVFLTEAGRFDKLVFDDDVGFGVKLGLDHPLGGTGRWWLAAGARYLRVLLEGEIAGQDGDLDPVIGTLGLAYRF